MTKEELKQKAKEYVIKKHNIDITKQPVDFSLRCEFAEDFTDFQQGAIWGYNKGKEEAEKNPKDMDSFVCGSGFYIPTVFEWNSEFFITLKPF